MQPLCRPGFCLPAPRLPLECRGGCVVRSRYTSMLSAGSSVCKGTRTGLSFTL